MRKPVECEPQLGQKWKGSHIEQKLNSIAQTDEGAKGNAAR